MLDQPERLETSEPASARDLDRNDVNGAAGTPTAHDSALKHVAGRAPYTDDVPVPVNCLHLALGLSDRPHANLLSLDLDRVRTAEGVEAVFTAEDVPGVNDASPFAGDDPLFAEGKVVFHGQPWFVVAAMNRRAARRAARLAEVTYEDLPAVLTIDEALAAQSFVSDSKRMQRGDPTAALTTAPHRLQGAIEMGGQDHLYLEGQVSLALPEEDGGVKIITSSQHPTEVQHNVAKVLGLPDNAVSVEVRRMGGGFGGKETQPAIFAAIAALVASKTGRAAKICLDRDDDMIITGKRHEFRIDYNVAFDDDGRISGLDVVQAARCGCSTDLSNAIADRAMFHADNAYYLPSVRVLSHRCRTNTVSNTAFRGFGGPQGMLGIERIIHRIAAHLGRDPFEVRKANLYGPAPRDMTPYGMAVSEPVLAKLLGELGERSDYQSRRADIDAFNADGGSFRKGIAITPVKFGISFTTTHLNQAGALIHVYTDGSVHLNHGGTEMGQGLFVKVAQVVAETFAIDIDRIAVSATHTGKVPNTSATAASSGSDLNGMAARRAALVIKERLTRFAAEMHQAHAEEVEWQRNRIVVRGETMTWETLIKQAYLARTSLSSTGFYATPEIHYDASLMQGRPFYYFAHGATVSEVIVDSLTGEYRIERVDILHDVGKSLNPAIDRGQIEGGFIQGAGWLTMEELWWDDKGRLRTHAPSTYKIPAASDRPAVMNIDLWEAAGDHAETVFRSKAVGEPPFMLAISVFEALQMAISSFAATPDTIYWLDAPATPEAVLMAIEAMKEGAQA